MRNKNTNAKICSLFFVNDHHYNMDQSFRRKLFNHDLSYRSNRFHRSYISRMSINIWQSLFNKHEHEK